MDGPVTEIALTGHTKWWWSGGEEVLFEDGDAAVGLGAGRALGFAEGGGRLLHWAAGLHWGLAGQKGCC
jgi:hypothetical protein